MRQFGKTIKYLTLCTLIGATVTSCDLDVNPPSNIAAETYWKTSKDAWYNLNAVYANTISGVGVYGETYTTDGYCQYSWESAGAIFQQDGFSALNDEGWNFEAIRKCNVYLNEVDNCDMDAALKTRTKAEVRTMRALQYLAMTMTFGKVPIITDVPAYDTPNVPRDEVSKVREFILKELTEAAADLPESYSGGGEFNEKGRITKYAALSIKARAALYFGQYDVAEAAAKDVIGSGKYSLWRITNLTDAQKKEGEEMSIYVDFADEAAKEKFVKGMFNYESLWFTENATVDNPEYILARQYVDPDQEDWVRYTAMRPNQLGGWSSVTPTQNLVDAYWSADGHTVPATPSIEARAAAYDKIVADVKKETAEEGSTPFLTFVAKKTADGTLTKYDYMKEYRNRDSRMYASILFPFKTWHETNYGAGYAYEWIKGGNNESKTGFNYRKMVALTTDSKDNANATGDYPCIRYAEILLIYAEAHTQTTGYDQSVRDALNDLRDRCGMPDVPATLTKDEALNLIRRERRVELAGEGFRGDDMTRYEDSYWESEMNNVPISMPDGETVITMKWSSRMRLKPIPQTAITLNPLLENDQNPGY